MSTPQHQAYTTLCPDWIWSTSSNMHMAKDRGWFTDYTPLEVSTYVTDTLTRTSRIPILGFGTVEIPTTCPRYATSSSSIIRLENVIHVPSVMCNILGRSLTDKFKIGGVDYSDSVTVIKPISSMNQGLEDAIAFFSDEARPYRLVVERSPDGYQLGSTVLSHGRAVSLGLEWPEEEFWKVFGTTARGTSWAWVAVD